MVLIRRFTLVAAVVMLLGCSDAEDAMAGAADRITIYYLPFSVETFVPVTIESIEVDARCVFSLDPSAEDIANLREWLARVTEGGFDKKRVRLKMVGLEDDPLYVDADGGLRRAGGKAGRLAPETFKALEQFVEAAAHRAGCDPYD
jgi:hypothetical protein